MNFALSRDIVCPNLFLGPHYLILLTLKSLKHNFLVSLQIKSLET